MMQSLERFLGKPKLTNRKSGWFSFGVYVLIGFVITIFLGETAFGAVAQIGPNMSKYDPIDNPAIDVTHVPPFIAAAGETVRLEFLLDCSYTAETDLPCKPEVTLYTAFGSKPEFQPVALKEEEQDSFRVLVAEIPILDANEKAMKYFLEINDPSVNIQYRYPLHGTIDVMLVPSITVIELLPPTTPISGDLVIDATWGSEPGQVGLGKNGGAPIGPDAFDMAPDGKIAVLDEVNKRVLLFDSQTRKVSSYSVNLKGWGDLAFKTSEELVVLDMIGESSVDYKTTPQLYLLDLKSKKVKQIGPAFVKGSIALTNESTLMDVNLGRMIQPLDSHGKLRPKNEQLKDYAQANLLARWQDDFRSRFADTQQRLAFEIRSTEPLGAIEHFSKTNDGYVVVFEGMNLRILWLDASGQLLSDVSVPNQAQSPIYPHGRIVVDKHGSVYYLSTTPSGLEIRRVNMK